VHSTIVQETASEAFRLRTNSNREEQHFFLIIIFPRNFICYNYSMSLNFPETSYAKRGILTIIFFCYSHVVLFLDMQRYGVWNNYLRLWQEIMKTCS
jgi:hypothetical protein